MKRVSCYLRVGLILIASLMLLNSTAFANETMPMPSDMLAKKQSFVATAGEFNHYPDSTIAVGGVVNLMNGAPDNAVILAGQANLGGPLGHHVLTSAGKINFNATSEGKTVLLGGTINSSPDSHMKQGGVIVGGDVNLTGGIHDNVFVVGGKVFLSGKFHGNVSVVAGKLTVLPSTKISGTLNYVSAGGVKISSKAKISGGAHLVSPNELTMTKKEVEFSVWAWILRIVQFLVAIIVVNLVCKQFPHKVGDTLKASPWKSLGVGLLFVFLGALVLPILIATIVGAYLFMLWLAMYALFILSGYLYVAQSIGLYTLSFMKKDMNFWLTTLAALIGLIILALINFIPVVGNWLVFVALLFGVGAIVRSSLCRSCDDNKACKA